MNVRSMIMALLGVLVWVGAPASALTETPASTLQTDVTPKWQKLSGEWRFLMGGISVEEGKDAAGGAALYADAKFDYRFNSWLKARITPSLRLFSSRVQERYDDDTLQSGISLLEGYLSVTPFSFLEARAGALNQGFHGTSMLISGLRSFPGAQEIVRIGQSDLLRAEVILQQAVPTSHTLNTEREREEKLPSFNTQTLMLKGRQKWLKWQATGGHYAWGNIPAKVVFESRRIGNVGYGENVPSNGYLYDHKGWYGTSELCYCTNDAVNFAFEYERIHNTEAPSDSADAQLWGLGPNFNFGEYVLDIRYRRYFVESDATIAYYNKSRYGNTNRIGDNIEITWHSKKDNFSIVAEAYFAEPINRDPNQRDLTVFFIGVETDYARF